MLIDRERRRLAVEETVARVNAERAAIGLPPGVRVGFTADGVAHLALTDGAAAPLRKRERVLLTEPAAPPGKRARIRL